MGFYANPAKTYLDALQHWKSLGMPEALMAGLDEMWYQLTSAERIMVARLIAWEIQREHLYESDKSS